MSVKVMGQVWELDLPHQEVLVLLAMADHADHEGRHVRPSLGLISWKTNYSKRQVIRIMQSLETKRLIRVRKAGGGRGRATEYTLHLENGVKKSPFRKDDTVSQFEDEFTVNMPLESTKGDFRNGDMVTPIDVNSVTVSPLTMDTQNQTKAETVTFATQNGDIAMSPQPSLEPSVRKTQDLTPPSYSPHALSEGEEGDMMAASFNRQAQKGAKVVLAHLNNISGINYTTPGQITQRLAEGATVEDGKLVIDWWTGWWSLEHPKQRDFLDPSTPFKREAFQRYLAKAKQWHAGGRLAPEQKAHTSTNGWAPGCSPDDWDLPKEVDTHGQR